MIHWLRLQTETRGNPLLVNGVSGDLLHFNDYGKALQEMLHFDRAPLQVPVNTLAFVLNLASPLKYLVSTSSKLRPERLIKLTRANAIRSLRLQEWAYPYAWPLERALTDWMERGIQITESSESGVSWIPGFSQARPGNDGEKRQLAPGMTVRRGSSPRE